MAVKLIALDLDGTTLTKTKALTDRNARALKAAIDKGINVVIATGRCYNAIPSVMKDFPGLQYAVSSNGAQLTDIRTGSKLVEKYHTPENVKKIAEIMRPLDLYSDMPEIFIDGQAYLEQELYDATMRGEIGYRTRDYVLKTRKPVKDYIGFMLDHKDKVENVNIFFPSEEERQKVRPAFDGIGGLTITTSWDWNIELGPADCTKAGTLRVLIDRLGVSRDEIMACGDQNNDLEMMKLAGIPVAVANAKDEVKGAAVFVTADNNSDGVGIAIEKFAL
ncbi:MAG: Cof-type HAD-IIB family hydrolase [Anaerovoracaceae bacterium]|nr:Cof-type HAD-IIB family hydrolase [Anaerovoracaceae bacterium]